MHKRRKKAEIKKKQWQEQFLEKERKNKHEKMEMQTYQGENFGTFNWEGYRAKTRPQLKL